MPASVASRRLILLGSWAATLGVIFYLLLGSVASISRSIYVLDAVVALSISATILGLLGIVAGCVMWAWSASKVWLLLSTIFVGVAGLSAAIFGDINIHGPEAILVFVMLAIVALGGLLALIAIIRFASSIWRKKASPN